MYARMKIGKSIKLKWPFQTKTDFINEMFREEFATFQHHPLTAATTHSIRKDTVCYKGNTNITCYPFSNVNFITFRWYFHVLDPTTSLSNTYEWVNSFAIIMSCICTRTSIYIYCCIPLMVVITVKLFHKSQNQNQSEICVRRKMGKRKKIERKILNSNTTPLKF